MGEFKPKVPDMTSKEKADLISNPENQAAQDEANMLRKQMGQNLFGEVKKYSPRVSAVLDREVFFNEQPTKHDYDLAFSALEQLKELATKETDQEKLKFKILRVLNLIPRTLQTALDSTLSPITMDPITFEDYIKDREKLRTRFQDAAYKLEELKKKGQTLGKEMADLESRRNRPAA